MSNVAEMIQTNLDTAHSEARAARLRTKKSHCPFGCTVDDVDDLGYCHHLVGFTNDKLTYEAVRPLYRHNTDGSPFDTGFKMVAGKYPCLPDDKFINPERPQIDKGIMHMAKEWVSDRVYRRSAEAPDPVLQTDKPSEEAMLAMRLRVLEKKLAEKQTKARIAELEKQLEDAELEEATAPRK